MDKKRPKRRKDKYNPYTLAKVGEKYLLSFQDGQGDFHEIEIEKELFDLLDHFELKDLSFFSQ